MTQKKRDRKKYAHQLILVGMETASKEEAMKAVDALLDVLEEMKLPKKYFPEIAKELKRFEKELEFSKEQWKRIASLITEFGQ